MIDSFTEKSSLDVSTKYAVLYEILYISISHSDSDFNVTAIALLVFDKIWSTLYINCLGQTFDKHFNCFNHFCIRFAVAPCSFSFVGMCGSEKNRVDLDVWKQYTLFVLRRDCQTLTGSGAYMV